MVLRGHPGVQDAVVLAFGTGDDVSLRAVYTGAAGITDELTRRCAERLPAYMVPARIHHVAALPTNANGKTDRRRAADLVGSATRGAR
nr:hypothetical protein [Micromonospora aurantiaca]